MASDDCTTLEAAQQRVAEQQGVQSRLALLQRVVGQNPCGAPTTTPTATHPPRDGGGATDNSRTATVTPTLRQNTEMLAGLRRRWFVPPGTLQCNVLREWHGVLTTAARAGLRQAVLGLEVGAGSVPRGKGQQLIAVDLVACAVRADHQHHRARSHGDPQARVEELRVTTRRGGVTTTLKITATEWTGDEGRCQEDHTSPALATWRFGVAADSPLQLGGTLDSYITRSPDCILLYIATEVWPRLDLREMVKTKT
eukprot:m.41550 g.41550  ORF g.41550 m.41550 type:complete len:254 (-) comp14226_c0_seq1:513-1274(-)